MTTGEKILTLRRARGWSQEELAGHIGVTRQALSRWESDTAVPDTVNVVEMADLFGVSCDYLLREAWTEDRAAVTQETPAKEHRVVAWIITSLGVVGVLATLILSCALYPQQSSWDPAYRWILVWMTRDLLWLPFVCWLALLTGIALLNRWRLIPYLRGIKREIWRNLGLDDRETGK